MESHRDLDLWDLPDPPHRSMKQVMSITGNYFSLSPQRGLMCCRTEAVKDTIHVIKLEGLNWVGGACMSFVGMRRGEEGKHRQSISLCPRRPCNVVGKPESPRQIRIVPSVAPVNCRWSAYGAWSDCDGCSKTQTRRRTIEVYAQFGGVECTGSMYETQPCVPTRGCPIEDGCGDRFRCFSGQCISKSLVCNGDHDCEEDSADETNCEIRKKVCDIDKYPPNTELTGLGFDIITQKLTKNVIHTKSFGGKCRRVYSGDSRDYFRLSENVLTYTFKVSAKNDFSYDFFNSTWSYYKHTDYLETSNTGNWYHNRQTTAITKEKSSQLMVIKNYIEVAQFINDNPEFLTLAEPFWKELANLPSVYEYSAYRKFIESYGTHFLQEGSLGGEYNFLFHLESEKMTQNGVTMTDMVHCTSSSVNFIFVKSSTKECKKLHDVIKSSSGSSDKEVRGEVTLLGGEAKFVSSLSYFSLDNPEANADRYAKWAGSVTNLPSVIKKKITPLYELVKEVPCAAVKKYYLKQAIEDYLNELDPCKCKPCQNHGEPAVVERKCVCLCKPNTFGYACEHGTLLQEDSGVIDGSWSCWSSWSSCLSGSRRRVRNRVCNNPRPSSRGKHCIGDSMESQQCEDGDLEHLRIVQPHCFDTSIEPTEFCPSPPLLENGFVKDASTVYPAGTRIVYTCSDGYTLVGEPVAKCGEDLTWQVKDMKCQRIMCSHPALSSNIRTAPKKNFYQVGDKISLSCPSGLDLEGPGTILCTSSLNWSPDIKNIQCTKKAATPKPDRIVCKPWEKFEDSVCSCKMPFECGSSLDICAIDGRNGKNIPLTVCKMHALQCLGRSYTVTQDTNCKFPGHTERSCGSCHLWEICSGTTNNCVCRDATSCDKEGISICVQVNGRQQTMTECEAGALKCQGENVAIVSISPCDV
ncbi:complement component C7 [Rhinophrynus dorsalis]